MRIRGLPYSLFTPKMQAAAAAAVAQVAGVPAAHASIAGYFPLDEPARKLLSSTPDLAVVVDVVLGSGAGGASPEAVRDRLYRAVDSGAWGAAFEATYLFALDAVTLEGVTVATVPSPPMPRPPARPALAPPPPSELTGLSGTWLLVVAIGVPAMIAGLIGYCLYSTQLRTWKRRERAPHHTTPLQEKNRLAIEAAEAKKAGAEPLALPAPAPSKKERPRLPPPPPTLGGMPPSALRASSVRSDIGGQPAAKKPLPLKSKTLGFMGTHNNAVAPDADSSRL